jgi:hypothetical protein
VSAVLKWRIRARVGFAQTATLVLIAWASTLVIASARVAAAGEVALQGPEVNKRTVEQIAD